MLEAMGSIRRAAGLFAMVCSVALPMAGQSPVRIEVNLAKSVGTYKPIYSWFGYDESNYTTMPHGKELLRELHDLSAVPVYIRAHHLLTSGNGVAELKWSSSNVFSLDAQGKPVYDFTITDQTFDAWKKAGVKPMVEFGFMPKDLAATVKGADTYQVHYPGDVLAGSANNPPKDYAMWGELVRRYTEHLVQRYGRAETSTWYWEVWNEPDIKYWHGTAEEYWKLYDFTVSNVRKALPGAKVGGPASTGPGGEHAITFLDNFLEHVANDKSAADGGRIPLDFISFHPKGSPKIVDGRVTMGISSELKTTENGFKVVAKYPQFAKLPIILSEADPEGCAACSSKVNPANNYRNGTLYPAYTAAAYKALFELQDVSKVNLLAMVSWSFEFEDKDYFEGFRSLATNGIDKPVLNVFRMFGMMAGDRVSTTSTGSVPLDVMVKTGVRESADVDAMATKSAHEATVLLWNYHDADTTAAAATATSVEVRGVPAGKVLVEHFRIDETHSNAYTVWKAMGSPQHPTEEQIARLKETGQLQMLGSPVWVQSEGGVVKLETEMPRQSVSLLRLSW
ncbi:GH39 family glycosyl hydrolase [Terriglobus saanensis]|uniref:Glycoside hydrolase family 39 n=1 Tax=Terriglobus saanensis (strain ATCC BAA-1853 / DSM 23119 / SP1PR4) TaxID=401053 RepID=E8V227_TERSS|nr:beta-xylosidase [Terriglobus saanensis]ADV84584.1 glycoside hydrolase family 39 [Terriglobus saanensis SP1PR4]